MKQKYEEKNELEEPFSAPEKDDITELRSAEYGAHERTVRQRFPEEYARWGQNLRSLREIEQAIQKRFRNRGFSKFTKALTDYALLKPGDKVAVAISGGKDSLFLAKAFQALHRYTDYPFEVVYLSMDPGYASENRRLLEFNCAWLNIPVTIFDSDVFEVAETISSSTPCYLCARMRRGFLYSKAQELGCNKIALGHHFNDVIETTLLNVLWSANYKNMVPKLKSQNFKGMELIRPLYYVEEKTIVDWRDFAGLQALDCACVVTKRKEGSKRRQIKELIAELKKTNPNVDKSIFRSGENVALDAILGITYEGKKHSFLEFYEEKPWTF